VSIAYAKIFAPFELSLNKQDEDAVAMHLRLTVNIKSDCIRQNSEEIDNGLPF
jgi:hypothetical protein